MLLLSFHIGTEHYAVSAKQIIEILPLTSVKSIPKAPEYIVGLLDYRGTPVPIIDLCILTEGRSYNKVLSSRIVLVEYIGNDDYKHTLGIIAEKVTEMLDIPEQEFISSGIKLENMPYLGRVAKQDNNMIQLVEIRELLTDKIQSIIFTETIPHQQAGNQ